MRWAVLAACIGAAAAAVSPASLDDSTTVEASHGGALGTLNAEFEAESEIPLDPLVESIQVVHVPPIAEQSVESDRFLTNSPSFAAMGVHLQVNLDVPSWDGINETVHERIEDNVRAVLTNTLPTLGILPSLTKGMVVSGQVAVRFPLVADKRPIVRAVVRTKVFIDVNPLTVCYTSSIPFVSASDEETSFYSTVIRNGLGTSRPGTQAPKRSASASARVAITGEGFHRRYTMSLKLLEPNVCGGNTEDKKILLRVPISSTSYLDLDEIRRMERFGELKLLSFAKHIEIERPSPVSSQHVVGLEFTLSSASDEIHMEYPIHFRYQAPSETDLYRPAFVIAPEIFLFCPSEKITGASDAAAASSRSPWLRLAFSTPLETIEVLTPVGYLSSDWVVSSGTLLFASLGADLLLWVSIQSSNSSGKVDTNWKAKLE